MADEPWSDRFIWSTTVLWQEDKLNLLASAASSICAIVLLFLTWFWSLVWAAMGSGALWWRILGLTVLGNSAAFVSFSSHRQTSKLRRNLFASGFCCLLSFALATRCLSDGGSVATRLKTLEACACPGPCMVGAVALDAATYGGAHCGDPLRRLALSQAVVFQQLTVRCAALSICLYLCSPCGVCCCDGARRLTSSPPAPSLQRSSVACWLLQCVTLWSIGRRRASLITGTYAMVGAEDDYAEPNARGRAVQPLYQASV